MSGRFVRASSYRHVFGEPAKDNDCFQDVRPATNGDGDYLAANTKYYACAVQGGGGPIQVGSLDATGRGAKAGKVVVHKAKVLDFAFHPFIDEMIATGSEDCYTMVTKFAEGGPEGQVTDHTCKLEGHQKKIGIVKWHPTAMNILATGSFDYTIKLWDIEAQTEVASFDKHTDVPSSMDWNSDGSLMLTSGKDKKLRIYDPRAPEGAIETDAFAGGKKQTALWLDNHGKIANVGFSKSSSRMYSLYDPKKFDKPIQEVDIDQSAGVFMVTYDPDNSILYLAGKGDSSIKYFEITDEDPYCHFLSEFRNSDSQKGICWVPKRGLDTSKCEVARALRLLRDKIQPVAFCVPRKSDMFQADIFPDTYAGESTISAADWLSGKNEPAKTQSMNPKNAPGAKKVATFEAKKSPAELQALLDAANKRIAELEAEVAKLKA